METSNVPVYSPPVREKTPPYALDMRDWIAAAVLFVLSFVAVSAGLWSEFHVGFTIAYVLLFLTYTVYFAQKGTRIKPYPLLCGVLSFMMSGVFFTTSCTLERFFALPVMATLAVIWFASLTGKTIPSRELGLASLVLRQIIRGVSRISRSIRSLFSSNDPHMRIMSKGLIGVLCAVPVLCAVIPLLIRSDAAFEGLMSHLFSDFASTAAQTILGILLFAFLIGFAFSMRKEPASASADRIGKSVDTPIAAAFLGVLSLVYLVYLFSQLAYFFSAFAGILPEDFSFTFADHARNGFAEYARRGFFELCWIAGINLCVLYLLLLFSKQKDGKLPVVLRILGTFIGLFTLLIICTAQSKMVLYMRHFGATVLRIGTSAFMLFMAVVFLTLLLRFYIAKIRVLPVAAVTVAIVLLVLGLGNVQRFAAWYNYNAYATGTLQTVDTAYLRKLGDEGIPYLIRLTDCKDAEIRRKACGQLSLAVEDYYTGVMQEIERKEIVDGETAAWYEHYLEPDGKIYPKFSEQSIPRKAAYDALDAFLEANPTFLHDHAADRTEAFDADMESMW